MLERFGDFQHCSVRECPARAGENIVGDVLEVIGAECLIIVEPVVPGCTMYEDTGLWCCQRDGEQ